ncbi:hypothetical protein K493DRAFT_318432 [Basidiobolus meristosporus CBS 931.73]|uniref:Mitochondrial zinc maintenance protein 1, mitochondrial n=1 Tax=Basidiobolus meristosporus CBS 931.73 TaxID=1314790 RepID=A0A1Y1XVI0_9FUNG|nr:hypothetical protein K493DRAFT_318432 [Basidiobolus meristosporus CBS 931.73]|eukprot:ORX89772.1 hypothetical protein K493DRAFT_318432 [Basidiobolus meristosporus CBS 931.73]
MNNLRVEVLGAYKMLLRSQRRAFKGDTQALTAAYAKTRQEFMNSHEETDEKVIKEKIDLAKQVATLLHHNIVQGVKKENEVYKLNLDQEHEINDNDSIRVKRSGTHSGGCCGGSGH